MRRPRVDLTRRPLTKGGGDTGGGSADGGGKTTGKKKRAPVKWRDARHQAGTYAARQLGRKGADKAKVEAGVKKIYKNWKASLSDADLKAIMSGKAEKK